MMGDTTAKAIRDNLVTLSHITSEGEPANLVDGLFAIAQSITRLAQAVEFLSVGSEGTNLFMPLEHSPLYALAYAVQTLANKAAN